MWLQVVGLSSWLAFLQNSAFTFVQCLLSRCCCPIFRNRVLFLYLDIREHRGNLGASEFPEDRCHSGNSLVYFVSTSCPGMTTWGRPRRSVYLLGFMHIDKMSIFICILRGFKFFQIGRAVTRKCGIGIRCMGLFYRKKQSTGDSVALSAI